MANEANNFVDISILITQKIDILIPIRPSRTLRLSKVKCLD